MLARIAQALLAIVGAVGGYELATTDTSIKLIADLIGLQPTTWFVVTVGIVAAVLGGLILYFIAPWCTRQILWLTRLLESSIQRMPGQDILVGVLGLIIGLVIANLLALALVRIPLVGAYLPVLANLLFGYLGISVALKKGEELWGQGAFWRRSNQKVDHSTPKVLDTSVIIDGRIADICTTGFLEGPLIIPGFVLEELRHIADSQDLLKRNRGRRGLDVLNKIQKDLPIEVRIVEKDFPDAEVDSKLIKLTKFLDGKILTNDYNLNKVCELQGVPVLNINELANAVKPVVLPGEEMNVYIVKDGKEIGQGVGYLDDGTMIVVDSGRRYIGDTITVVVTSVLQTAAGRMIFAKLKTGAFNG